MSQWTQQQWDAWRSEWQDGQWSWTEHNWQSTTRADNDEHSTRRAETDWQVSSDETDWRVSKHDETDLQVSQRDETDLWIANNDCHDLTDGTASGSGPAVHEKKDKHFFHGLGQDFGVTSSWSSRQHYGLSSYLR